MAIAVDLDGTLAYYDGWKGVEHIGAPIPAMMDRVVDWIHNGEEVVIFTARASNQDAIDFIQVWLEANGIGELDITNIKRKSFREFWDDRAVSVVPNTGRIR